MYPAIDSADPGNKAIEMGYLLSSSFPQWEFPGGTPKYKKGWDAHWKLWRWPLKDSWVLYRWAWQQMIFITKRHQMLISNRNCILINLWVPTDRSQMMNQGWFWLSLSFWLSLIVKFYISYFLTNTLRMLYSTFVIKHF